MSTEQIPAATINCKAQPQHIDARLMGYIQEVDAMSFTGVVWVLLTLIKLNRLTKIMPLPAGHSKRQ